MMLRILKEYYNIKTVIFVKIVYYLEMYMKLYFYYYL